MTIRRSRFVFSFALIASTLALGSPGLGAQTGCDEPYPAVFAARTTGSPTVGFRQVFPAEPVEAPVTLAPVGGDEVSGFFEFGDDSTIVRLTEGDGGTFLVPAEITDQPEDGRINILEADGREYLAWSRFETVAGRSVGFLVLWDLDDPCRQLPPLTSTTTTAVDATTVPATTPATAATTSVPAPRPPAPATPVRAAASYTG